MTGFKPWISGVGSDRFTNWAATTAQNYYLIKGQLSALSGPQIDFIQAIHKYSNITVKHFMDEKYQAQTEFSDEKQFRLSSGSQNLQIIWMANQSS